MKLVNLAIGITITVIIMATFLIPVIDDAIASDELTKTNGGIRISKITDSWSADFVSSGGSVTATVNGNAVTVNDTASMYTSNMTSVIFNSATLNLYHYDESTSTVVKVNGATQVTVTCSGGTTTIFCDKNGTESTYTYTPDWAYGYDATGDHIVKYIQSGAATTIYYNDVKDIRGSFITLGNNTAFYCMEGDKVILGDGTEIAATVTTGSTDSDAVISVAFQRSSSSGYTFTYDNATEYPMVVIAPQIVTGVIHPGFNLGMLAVIPLIVIAALIIWVVVQWKE